MNDSIVRGTVFLTHSVLLVLLLPHIEVQIKVIDNVTTAALAPCKNLHKKCCTAHSSIPRGYADLLLLYRVYLSRTVVGKFVLKTMFHTEFTLAEADEGFCHLSGCSHTSLHGHFCP